MLSSFWSNLDGSGVFELYSASYDGVTLTHLNAELSGRLLCDPRAQLFSEVFIDAVPS